MISATELIEGLGGTNAAARFFGVKPPSVTAWSKAGVIPEDKLIRKAAALERALPGRFSREDQWPDECREIWPELPRSTSERAMAAPGREESKDGKAA